ncbi:MAG TPA: methylenetetrahydrofolate reductase, partial [Xanthobacteraceae bacterium]
MTTVEARADPIDAIADFMAGFSLEATRPSAEEVAALTDIAPAGARVYISAVPKRPAREAIEAAARLRQAGFEPVPHLAARGFANTHVLDDLLARMGGEAGVVRLLVIAGDHGEPTGEFRSAIEVIDGGALQRHGICEIGVAGYPDGHPRLVQQDLDRALADKIRAAESTGLAVHIVTQFCFDVQAILQWITRLRDFGIEHPVRIGLAGPTSLATLLRYAKRCGVRASAHSLARQAGLVRQLFAMSAPDALVRALAQARAERHLGEIAPHFFSFGGLARTARWAEAVAQRHIALEAG